MINNYCRQFNDQNPFSNESICPPNCNERRRGNRTFCALPRRGSEARRRLEEQLRNQPQPQLRFHPSSLALE